MKVSLRERLAGQIGALPVLLRALLAFVCGAIMVPAMPPWCLWPCLFAGLTSFYILLSTVSGIRCGFGFGWLFGFGYFAFGLSWIANALLVEGNEFAWAWPLAVAGLPALLALFPALACALVVHSGKNLKRPHGYLLFVALLCLFEWLRGHIFTGFPWNLYGYTWASILPIAQLASIGGIYWLTLLTVLAASLPGLLILWDGPRRIKGWLVTFLAAAAFLAWLYGSHRLDRYATEPRKDIVIRLVQPDIQQEDKWNPDKASANLDRILSMSEARPVNRLFTTVIVWPETAISDYLLANPSASAAIRTVLSGYDEPVILLTGIMRTEKNGSAVKYYNSLAAYDRNMKRLAVYDKAHLVPFGEYIPFQKFIPLKPITGFAGFQHGPGPQNLTLPETGAFSPLVCYEVIFPGAVTPDNDRPGFIVNVTNDSWYGDSAGPRQHFVMAQFRAIEEGLPVIRSANTGISGIIDPVGRVLYQYKLNTAGGDNLPLPDDLGKPTIFESLKDRLFWISLLILSAYPFIYSILHPRRS